MRPLRLTLCNFLGHADTDLDLSGVTVAAICGPNGAGKSSLLDAVSWSLHGKSRASTADGVIREGADEAAVAHAFSHAGEVYRVTRRRVRGQKTWLTLEQQSGAEWADISEPAPTAPSVPETQRKIDAILRLPWNVFAASALAMQGDAARFTLAPPAKRREILSSVLGLDKYAELEEGVKKRQAEVKEEIAGVTAGLWQAEDAGARLPRLTADLTAAGKEVEKAAAAANEAEAALTAARDTETAAKVEAEARRGRETRLAECRERLGKKQDELARIRRDLAGARKPNQRRLAKLERLLADATEPVPLLAEADAWEKAQAGVWQNLQAAQEKAAMLESSNCDSPTKQCVFLEDAQRAAGELPELQRKAGEQMPPRLVEARKAAALREKHREELAPLRLAAASGPLCEAAGRVAEEIRELEGGIGLLKAEVAAGRNAPTIAQEAEQHRRNAETAVRTAGETLAAAIRREAEAAAAHREALRLAETGPALRERLVAQQRTAEDLGVLREAYSPQGIPALITENAVGQLEQAAGEVLEHFGGTARLRLVTRRTTGDGREVEVLDVVVADAGGAERPYELWSGGERIKADLALRVGLAELLARRHGAPVEFLALDEVVAPLDQPGREAFLECVRALARWLSLILVISHSEEIAESLPWKINVDKGTVVIYGC